MRIKVKLNLKQWPINGNIVLSLPDNLLNRYDMIYWKLQDYITESIVNFTYEEVKK